MQKKIAESTAGYPLGKPMQSRLFTLPGGEYAGRRIALFQSSSSDIMLTTSDAPGQSWQTAVTIVSDAANRAFDCVLAPNGDIHIAYVEASTNHLVTVKLTFADGEWTVGSGVTIFNEASCYDPALAIDSSGVIWVSWARYSSPVRRIHVKSSNDGGATWGSGSSDEGEIVSHATMFIWAKVIATPRFVRVLYVDQDSGLYMRSIPIGGETWDTAQIIAQGTHFTAEFDVAMSPDGRLGVVFDNEGLLFREFDGNLWGEMHALAEAGTLSPQLRYRYATPVITWLKGVIGVLQIPMTTYRRGGSFVEPMVLDSGVKSFDGAVLYNQSEATYIDRTTQAASYAPADFYHPHSGCLLNQYGDALYLGMDAPFRTAYFALSTPGVGGTLACSYFDGSQWRSFTPSSGAVTLADVTDHILFWDDPASIPENWQKCQICGDSRFWLKIEVTSTFTTGPVGSYATAAAQFDSLSVGR